MDSLDALIAIVSTERYAAILPKSYQKLLPPSTQAIPIDPVLPAARIGLVLPDHSVPSAVAQAVLAAARALKLPEHFGAFDSH